MFTHSLLAEAVSKQFRVKVICDDMPPCTLKNDDGICEIHIPVVTSDDMAKPVEGFLWHEVAHAAYSVLELTHDLESPVRELNNIFEDVRVERTLLRTYPGAQYALKAVQDYVFDDDDRNENNPLDVILSYVRGLSDLPAKWEYLRDTLNKHTLTESSQDCLDLAQEVAKLLPEQPEQAAQGAQSQDGQAGQPEKDQGDSDKSESDQTPYDLAKAFQKKATGDADPKPMMEIRYDEARVLDPRAGDTSMFSGLLGRISYRDKTTSKLLALMQSFVQSYILDNAYKNPYKGKLSTKNLYRLHTEVQPKIFRSLIQRQGMNAYICLIVDGSGSMDGEGARIASQAAYTLRKALSSLRGLTVECVAMFDDKLKLMDMRNYSAIARASGMTPLGAAYQTILRRAMSKPNSRKVIFTITDGVLNDPSLFEACYNESLKYGIETYGIGICTDPPKCLKASCTIENIEELPEKLWSVTRATLFA